MKTKIKSTPIIASEGLEQSVMGMDNHGRDMATYFLRDKIYANKIKAVVREYICNAVDEHNKYGIDRPVEVNLKGLGLDQAIFSVRDHAKGLSDDGVRNIFGMYFRSTKSESNDSIGGYGVGSKAGHAYTDTFNIISHFEGVKTSYSCMLGAGDNNVPVGHIYKLDSCPTDETGVEINLEVKAVDHQTSHYGAKKVTDVEKFKKEIIHFVQFAHSSITANIFDTVYNTPEQKHTTTIDGFTISVIDLFTEERTRSYNNEKFVENIVGAGKTLTPILKMGDVVYNQLGHLRGVETNEHKAVMITAPVGSIDIPISREGMEETERNTRLLERANQAIDTVAEKDAEPLKKKTLIELTDSYLKTVLTAYVEGNYFRFSPKFVYSEYYDIADSIRDHTHSDLKTSIKDITKEDGKPVLVVIPNNRATETWIGKVKSWCDINDKKYLSIKEGADMKTLDDHFTVKEARKLKFPKNAKKQNCAIVWNNAQNEGSYTALQFHNKMRGFHDLSRAKDLAEAKKQNDELAKSDKAIILKSFILADRKTSNRYYHGHGFNHFVSAKGLLKDLKEIGILRQHEGGKIEERVNKIRLEESNREQSLKYATNLKECSWVSDRTKKIIDRNPSKALRIVEMFDELWQETSLRSSILKKFINLNHYWGGQKELSKDDLKRIMKLV